MAKFKKGESGNPEGRTPGTKNKSTEQIKQLLTDFIGANIDDLQDEYNKLESKEKLMFFEKLTRFIIPQKNETESAPEEVVVIRPRRDNE